MENVSRWVKEQTDLLAPPDDFQPDSHVALARFRMRVAHESRYRVTAWLPWVAAAALGCAAIFMIPNTRALAQQLWQLFSVSRVEVLRLDVDLLESSSLYAKMLNRPGPSVRVRDVEEARLRTGYTPRLPQPGILSGSPQLSTHDAMVFGTVVKAADLELLLAKKSIADEPVPPHWDGARIVLQTGAIVNAEWEDIALWQSPLPQISVSPGFDLPAFLATVLRGLGVPKAEAQRLAQRMKEAPAFLLPVDSDERMGVREVTLRRGPATMIYDYDADDSNKIQRITLIWSVPDRMYMLSGGPVMSDALAIAIANSIE